mgnify:CR=1 FL=1
MALLTSNASALVSGRSLFSEGKLMKIEMLRDTVVEGKAVSVGDVIKCSDDEGIKMCQMGKARPASEKAKKPKHRDDLAAKLSTR